jgi:hypothetical protein
MQNIPRWAIGVLQGPEFSENYVLSAKLNPFLVQGDFNGDGVLDIAVLISRRTSGTQGIAILHAGGGQPLVMGAGRKMGNGGDDFSWMNAWSVYSKGPVYPGVNEGKPPKLRGDALLVEKLESASAIIYWDGAAYRWYQQGD